MNVWGILLQAIEVSLVAALILIVKKLFENKLSPRWQYSIWILLAAKILVPSGFFGRYLSLNVAAYLEMLKTHVEANLHSAYSGPFSPLEFSWILPFGAAGRPESVTDWLLVVYLLGTLTFLIKYAVSYGKLRAVLRQGTEFLLPKMSEDLPVCRAVMVDGIPSAFVCGIIHPVLAVPTGNLPDDKVILHELLHLKYRDALQSVFWCVLKSLNWYNPLMHYVFNHIGNDMESLCDQRVLERLEGEERRDYGRILLAMTDDKYARAPGTTSISNGGKNISRRIKAIARFKKYPKGMELVSLCIVLVLATPVFAGDQMAALEPENSNVFSNAQFEMAKSRLIRCTTPAGAIDTWVKGQVFNHPGYLAASSPEEEQEILLQQTALNRYVEYELFRFNDIDLFNDGEESLEDYAVLNMRQTGEKEYKAEVVLILTAYNAESRYSKKMLSIPVKITHEDGWVVEQTDMGQLIKGSNLTNTQRGWGFEELPGVETYIGEGNTGRAKVKLQCIQSVDNFDAQQGDMFFGGTLLNQAAKPDAEFDTTVWNMVVDWKSSLSKEQRKDVEHIRFTGGPVYGNDGFPKTEELQRIFNQAAKPYWNGAWRDKEGHEVKVWDGTLNQFAPVPTDKVKDITGFGVLVYQNHKLAEYIKIERQHPAALYVQNEDKQAEAIEKCTTPAGAIDTFAKGLIYSNREYLHVCREIPEDLIRDFRISERSSDYRVFNLKKVNDREYNAIIGIYEEPKEDADFRHVSLISVKAYKDDSWFVELCGDDSFGYAAVNEEVDFYGLTHLSPMKMVAKECGEGMVYVKLYSYTPVKGTENQEADFDAEFGETRWCYRVDWKWSVDDEEPDESEDVVIACGIIEDMNRVPQWLAEKTAFLTQDGMSSSTGWGSHHEAADGDAVAITGQMSQKTFENHEGIQILLYKNKQLKENLKIRREELK